VVVLLSTLKRSSLETMVQEVPGIDAVIGVAGGMQTQPVSIPGAEGEAVLHAAATRGEYLGWLTLNLDAEGRVTGFDGHAIALTDRFADDPEMVEVLRERAKGR
jgi:2',3'-cyclic-nucleotide 2'-phosphodiesterase (5'-nucleotidase family)